MLSAVDEMEAAGDTGLLREAAVDGFRSWAGDGFRLIDADCIVEAMSIAGFAIVDRGLSRPWRNHKRKYAGLKGAGLNPY